MLQVEVKKEVGRVVGDKRIRKSLVFWAGYFGLLMGLRLLVRGFESFLSLDWVLFLIGGWVGMFVWLVDKLVYVYYTRPEDGYSVRVKGLISGKQWKEALRVLWQESDGEMRLAMNNVLFMGVWCGLGLFLMTSSASMFARGLVLGIGLELVVGLYHDWEDQEALMGRLFWPVMRRVSRRELKFVVAGFVAMFLWLSWMGV